MDLSVTLRLLKGGEGSGHRGHTGGAGGVGNPGGSVAGTGTAALAAVKKKPVIAVKPKPKPTKIASAIKRMMPSANRKDLDIPATGLVDARTKDGYMVTTIAYNPTTGDLLAGGGSTIHSDLVYKYAPGATYDDYVKIHYTEPEPYEGIPRWIRIYVSRVSARDPADAWNKGFDAVRALARVGLPRDTDVELRVGEGKGSKSHVMTVGEMTKEVGAMVKKVDDGWIIKSTLGELADLGKSGKASKHLFRVVLGSKSQS